MIMSEVITMTLRQQMEYGPPPDYIAHHGILGMHWGIRRTPSQLGHPTPEPRKLASGKTGDYKNDGETVKQTYGKGKTRIVQSRNGETPKNPSTGSSKLEKVANKPTSVQKTKQEVAKTEDTESNSSSGMKKSTYVKIGVGVAAGALAAYGAYKVHQLGTNEIARRGGDLVGKILGAKDRAIDSAKSAANEFQSAKTVSQQKAKLKNVLPTRENTMKQVMEKYKDHPEISASVADWVTRDNKASVRFGSVGNSVRDLEEYLSRAWPQIVRS